MRNVKISIECLPLWTKCKLGFFSHKNILFFEGSKHLEDANLLKRFLSAKVLVESGKVHERNIIVKNTDYTNGILSRKSSRKWSFSLFFYYSTIGFFFQLPNKQENSPQKLDSNV